MLDGNYFFIFSIPLKRGLFLISRVLFSSKMNSVICLKSFALQQIFYQLDKNLIKMETKPLLKFWPPTSPPLGFSIVKSCEVTNQKDYLLNFSPDSFRKRNVLFLCHFPSSLFGDVSVVNRKSFVYVARTFLS